ncbi:hypothetical protein, partial [Xanthomonas citri]|uniref:hypothetical protein n=1 Tax=Xanthomonas citri TaxID=346 RepID=UPI00197D593E
HFYFGAVGQFYIGANTRQANGMTEHPLTSGIQAVLSSVRQRRSPTAQDIAQEAIEARESLETNMGCMSQIGIPTGSERHRVAFSCCGHRWTTAAHCSSC